MNITEPKLDLGNTKRCSKCGGVKVLSEFSTNRARSDGRGSYCKVCKANYERERRRLDPEKTREQGRKSVAKWCALHPEERRERAHKYRAEHPEKIREYCAKYRARHVEECRERDRKYRAEHPEKIREYRAEHLEECREYYAERYKTDPQYRIACQLRSRLNHVLKGKAKNGSAVRDLGCSIEELQVHLEAQWQLGMTWKNQGRHKGKRCWEIDHIIPLASFDLAKRKQFLKACNYTNLQPMWADENRAKGARQLMA